MKLFSLQILTKNTKKSKNNFEAPKKSEIVIFPGRILPCKQNKSVDPVTNDLASARQKKSLVTESRWSQK